MHSNTALTKHGAIRFGWSNTVFCRRKRLVQETGTSLINIDGILSSLEAPYLISSHPHTTFAVTVNRNLRRPEPTRQAEKRQLQIW